MTFDTGLRNDSGHSPLDTTNLYIHEDCLDVARYLIQRNGTATEEEMAWLMKGACYWGKRDLLNDLVGECIQIQYTPVTLEVQGCEAVVYMWS